MNNQHLKTIQYVLLAFLAPFVSFYPAAKAQNTSNSLLYKISGKGLKQDSYLYGTIHVMPKKDFSISEKITKAFNQCSVLAMEIDLNMDLKTKISVAQQTILPNNQTLENLMNASEYNRLKQYVIDSMHVKKSKFKKYERLKPFFFSSAIMQEQMKDTESYEVEFNKMAKKRKMQTAGLESIYSQLDLVNKMPTNEQLQMLTSELYSANETNSFDKMIELYKNEDTEALYKVINDETAGMTDFTEDFLVKRNKNWIPAIETLVAQNATFIAVGAGHLGGEKGVIALLKKQGYTVTPVY